MVDRSRTALFLALLLAACGRNEPLPGPAPAAATTPEEARALARVIAPRLGPPPGGWRAIRDPRGRTVIDHRGRFPSMTVLARAADGSLRVQCVGTPAEAEAALSGARPAHGGPGR